MAEASCSIMASRTISEPFLEGSMDTVGSRQLIFILTDWIMGHNYYVKCVYCTLP